MIWYEIWRPAMHRERLIRLVDDGIKSVIIEGYHSGTAHACSEDVHPNCPENIVPFLEHARDKKVPVFLTFGYFVGDEDSSAGYQSFDEGKAGSYITSYRMIKAGIVPLRTNWQQVDQVCQRLEEVLSHTEEYNDIIREMYEFFPFRVSLNEIRASVESTDPQ